jgi:endonuclease/exonuclease/phosphatase family metal-dependent hydrolase
MQHSWFLPLGAVLAAACSQHPPAAGSPSPPGASQPSGTVGSAASSPRLKIATWNLEWLYRTSGAGTVARSDADYARLARYAEQLDADVIAVQEVDGEEALRRVFDDSVYDYHVTSQRGVQRTGFAYRASLVVTRNADYAALDVGGVRTGADLSVSMNGQHLRLLSVHLKSGCFDQPLTKPSNDCTKLAAQLPVLEAWIDTRAAAGEPSVVLGDFNRRMQTGEVFFAELDDADPPNAELTLVTDGRSSRCWGGEYARFIDHIVLSLDAAAWLVPSSFVQLDYAASDAPFKSTLSDHCPLSVVLTPGEANPGEDEPKQAPAPGAQGARLVKGNVSAGRRLYHLPECPSYEDTRIDELEGERYFASEAEALAAGWQKAGNCP